MGRWEAKERPRADQGQEVARTPRTQALKVTSRAVPWVGKGQATGPKHGRWQTTPAVSGGHCHTPAAGAQGHIQF